MATTTTPRHAVRGLLLILVLGLIVGCAGRGEVDADGAFVGSVTRVWRDGLQLDIPGDNLRVDTWAVCGDNTSTHIRVGDNLRVWATRDLFSWDASRIETPSGAPACPR